MKTIRMFLVATFLLTGCIVGSDEPGDPRNANPQPPTTPTNPTPTTPTPPTNPTSGPQLIDSDEDGAVDSLDIEPDGDPDYAYITESCGDPRVDQNKDGVIDAFDLDCNGQIDLHYANGNVTPAPGANCFAGQPGQGPGHGAAGVGCD